MQNLRKAARRRCIHTIIYCKKHYGKLTCETRFPFEQSNFSPRYYCILFLYIYIYIFCAVLDNNLPKPRFDEASRSVARKTHTMNTRLIFSCRIKGESQRIFCFFPTNLIFLAKVRRFFDFFEFFFVLPGNIILTRPQIRRGRPTFRGVLEKRSRFSVRAFFIMTVLKIS